MSIARMWIANRPATRITAVRRQPRNFSNGSPDLVTAPAKATPRPRQKTARKMLLSPFMPGSCLLFFGDDYGDFHRDVLMQFYRHLVLAQLAYRIVQLNLAPVDVVVLRGESFGDILARHRAE